MINEILNKCHEYTTRTGRFPVRLAVGRETLDQIRVECQELLIHDADGEIDYEILGMPISVVDQDCYLEASHE